MQLKVFKKRKMCKSCQVMNEDILKKEAQAYSVKDLEVLYKRRNKQVD